MARTPHSLAKRGNIPPNEKFYLIIIIIIIGGVSNAQVQVPLLLWYQYSGRGISVSTLGRQE